jgi:hypothetical protein
MFLLIHEKNWFRELEWRTGMLANASGRIQRAPGEGWI